jgi:hypothetical protein
MLKVNLQSFVSLHRTFTNKVFLTFSLPTFTLSGTCCGRNLSGPEFSKLQTFGKKYTYKYSVLYSIEIRTKTAWKTITFSTHTQKNKLYKWKYSMIILSRNAKYHLNLCILWNSKDLPVVYSWNLSHIGSVKNNHTIYNKPLFRVYASMNCVTSQFMITPFSAHTLTHICHISKQSTTHRSTSHIYNRRECSWFSYLANTHENVFVFRRMASVANISPL